MATVLNPYIGFRGNAREAMEFYQSVFGGELTLRTFADFQASEEPDEQNLIMHGHLVTPGGLTLMGSDTPKRMDYTPGDNFSISVNGTDEVELRGYFDKLLDGGTQTVPLEKAPWGDSFGMGHDRFGVNWLINIYAS